MNESPSTRRQPSMDLWRLQRASSTISSEQSLVLFNVQTNFDEHFKIVDEEMETSASNYYASRPSLAYSNIPGMLFHASISNDGTNCDETESGVGEFESVRVKGSKMFARRHSSFEPRQALQSYIAHCEMKEHFNSTPEEQRAKCVESLLNFHDSVNVMDFNFMEESAALHFSCPVLSYMNDEEEDSVDLVAFKRKLRRRSSTSVIKEEEELWEFLQDLEDEPTNFDADGKILPAVDNEKPQLQLHKERRHPSYKVLARKLATESPEQILHSLESSYSSFREMPSDQQPETTTH